jgi:hypothetical protein
MQGDQWTVNHIPFSVNSQTDVLGTYAVGDAVLASGRILSPGVWVADSIVPAADTRQLLSFTGLLEEMSGVPGDWKIGGMVIGVNDQTKLEGKLKVGDPVKVTALALPGGTSYLAEKISRLEEDEDEKTRTPVSTRTVTVTTTGTPATQTPTVTPSQTVTPSSTPTLTVTVTGTILPSGTVTLTPLPSSTVLPKNDTSRCDNRSQQQPEAMRLAQRYSVPYDEIMQWFCKGFGFGEIDLAYGLSKTSGLPVSDIFSMRSSGLGWGEIKKKVAPTAVPGGPGNGNGKGNRP